MVRIMLARMSLVGSANFCASAELILRLHQIVGALAPGVQGLQFIWELANFSV